jgi:hypothetical protein
VIAIKKEFKVEAREERKKIKLSRCFSRKIISKVIGGTGYRRERKKENRGKGEGMEKEKGCINSKFFRSTSTYLPYDDQQGIFRACPLLCLFMPRMERSCSE